MTARDSISAPCGVWTVPETGEHAHYDCSGCACSCHVVGPYSGTTLTGLIVEAEADRADTLRHAERWGF